MLLDFLFQSLIIFFFVLFCLVLLTYIIYFLVLSWGGFQKIWNMFSTKKKMSKHNWSHFFKGEEKKQRFTIGFWSILGWYKEFLREMVQQRKFYIFRPCTGLKLLRETCIFLSTRGKFCTFLKKELRLRQHNIMKSELAYNIWLKITRL